MDERRMDTYAAHTSNEGARSTVIPGVRTQKRDDFLFPRQQSSRIPARDVARRPTVTPRFRFIVLGDSQIRTLLLRLTLRNDTRFVSD